MMRPWYSEKPLTERLMGKVWLAYAFLCLLASTVASSSSPMPAQGSALSPGDKVSSTTAPSLSAEPAQGFWGQSSSLSLARQDFQALVLQQGTLDGKVLAIGGCCSGGSSLASSEIFDPKDGSWQTVGEMQSPRWLFQAIALPNGSALAIGGLSIAKGGVLNSTEMFIPATNGSLKGSWKSVAAMNTPRQDFAALAMEDGTVMAVGGFMASTEIYDPEKDQWTQTSRMSMHDARSAFEMVRLASGKILAVGGRGRGSSVVASSEVFNPVTQTWQEQGSMKEGRVSFSLVPLSDKKWMAAGGMSDSGKLLNSTEIYDQDSGVWSQGPDMIYHRTQQQGVALPSGRILMVGGLGGLGVTDTSILDTAEVYDPESNNWTLTDAMVDARYVFQMVKLPNGTAMAIGGTGVTGFTSSTELFETV